MPFIPVTVFFLRTRRFASACESAGIVFIGPPNTAIDVMGDKARAKRAMLAAGVPCVPGYQGDDQSVATLVAESQQIGMPVMVKAAAGGGGRGMRLVEDITQLAERHRVLLNQKLRMLLDRKN